MIDSVTLPALHALLMESGFIGSFEHNYPELDPLTLSSIKNMLVQSQCQNTLRTVEFCRITLTNDILAIIQLSPALDAILLEVSGWETEANLVFQHLLAELECTNSDSTLSCVPSLSLLTLHVKYTPRQLMLSFYQDDLVDVMESRLSSLPDMRFSLSILIENNDALFVSLKPNSRARLVQSRKNGSVCTFTIGDVIDEHDSIVHFLDCSHLLILKLSHQE